MLAERREQLAILDEIFSSSANGHGAMAVVEGQILSGKTALLRAMGHQVKNRGAILLTAAGSPEEQELPGGVLNQLLNSAILPPEIAARADALLDGLTHPDNQGNPDGHGVVPGFFHGILRDLAREHSVVVVVDDVEFSDAPSLHALRYLTRRLQVGRLMVVFSQRPTTATHQLAFHNEILGRSYCEYVPLLPLSVQGVQELISDGTTVDEPQDLARRVHAVSGGNPLLVQALLKDNLGDAAEPAAELVAGKAFQRAVATCFHRLGQDSKLLAQGIAMLGRHATPELAEDLVGLRPYVINRAMDGLTGCGLVEEGRFRHPQAQAVVLGTVGAELRGQLHLRAAQLLRHSGAEATTIAAQLVAAGSAPESWCVSTLEVAADHAIAAGDAKQAVKYLDLAAQSCSGGRRTTILSALAKVEWLINPSSAVRHVEPLCAAAQDGGLQPIELATLSNHLLWLGRLDELEQTLAGAVAHDEMAELHASEEFAPIKQFFYYAQSSLWDEAQATPTNGVPGQAAALLYDVLRGQKPAGVSTYADQILQSSRLGDGTMPSTLCALLTLIYADQTERANEWCEALLEDSAARGLTTWQAVLYALWGEIALRGGDFHSAEQRSRSSMEIMSPQSWGVMIGFPLSTLVQALTSMGRHKDARQMLKTPVPRTMFRTRFGLHYLHARGQHSLMNKRFHAALMDFQRCGDLMSAWRMDIPGLVPWRVGAAQAQLRLGNRVQAEKLAKEQLATFTDSGQRVKLAAQQVLASTDAPALPKHTPGLRPNRTAAARPSSTATLEKAKLAIDKGGTLTSRPVLSTTATGQARPVGGGMSVLSEAERRVAGLAVQGATNREISRKLFVTLSTVEQHLTHIYRKLSIGGRSDLPSVLLQTGQTADECECVTEVAGHDNHHMAG
ncbi:hypothetical protein ALI144C_04710 [Actinosynnema sp. ALI-1.44]|nr:hypothetical protein ALI144C_04710 [Actinosynnema sp. ALI-1.44]